MAATTTRHSLTDDELIEVLTLARESDSVELKVTVPDAHYRSTVTALDMDPIDAQIRLIYFFDTPDLVLDHHGLVVRARRIQGRGDDSVVKLRPVVPHELPAAVRNSPNVTVEVDALPGGYVCSAAMKRLMSPDHVRASVHEGSPLRKLFSKEQRAFFREHAPGGVELDDLTPLGPILVLKLRKAAFPNSKRKAVAELWHYPDNTLILELSTKALPAEAIQVAGEARALLAEKGIDLSGEQRTKTKTALELFSAEVAANAGAAMTVSQMAKSARAPD
jgi:hypothetical protein